MRSHLLFLKLGMCLALLAFPVTFLGQEKQETVTIKGTAVAYQGGFLSACWHVCTLWIIVKLDKPSKDKNKYVLLSVAYMDDRSKPDNGLPNQLISKAARWKFTASKRPESAEPLQQYMNANDANGNDLTEQWKIPAWGLVKGSENELLPFGEPIPRYSVRPGKFKSLN